MTQKRSIFEDVASDEKTAIPTPQTGLIDKARRGARGAIRAWLAVLFGIVVLMIVVGGLTRLTDSGLSITEWKPVSGALPPMSAEKWQAEFARYQAIPEYQLQNKGMSLAEFKAIYWWEWGHRQLGRIIGLVWAVGLLFFWATSRIPTGWGARLIGVGVLGGLQGVIGWWMVSSGLGGDMLDVASYRLAIHLGLAFAILGLIAWYMLRLARAEADLMQARRAREARLGSLSTVLLVLTFGQILLGALVAGIDAGRGYTDWPLMAGQFFPADAFDLIPWWRNFLEDDGLVQFMHRIAGYVVVIFGLCVWWRSRASGNVTTRRAYNWIAAMVFGQMVLGVGTVLYSAPLLLAILHQLGAVVLWVAILRARFLSQYPPTQSLRGARA